MADERKILGYYHWEGDPCRVVVANDGYNSEAAEIYVAGEGFVPIGLSDVYHEGVPIGEAEFKRLVLESIQLAKV